MGSKEDEMIDAALAGYSRVDPLSGMEQRVWRRIHDARAARRRVWFGLAAAVAAASLLVTSVLREPQPHLTIPPPKTTAFVLPPQVIPVNVPRIGMHHRKRLVPRQFPLPAPLSVEERALLALVTEHPAIAGQIGLDKPVEIQPIEIKPLPGDGGE